MTPMLTNLQIANTRNMSS